MYYGFIETKLTKDYKMTNLTAMFDNVQAFAVFNSKSHLFATSTPTQLGCNDADQPVFVSLKSGCAEMFAVRVNQFGGIVLPCVD